MRLLLAICLLALRLPSLAQDQTPFKKFGAIRPVHLQKKIYPVDSNASAVVLMDHGRTTIEGNSDGWFSVVFKRHKVVHILNRDGFHEADVEIPLYMDGSNKEELKYVKASTYNLVNGRRTVSSLERNHIYSEKVNEGLEVKKFTLPAIAEGSIIEYEYEVVSDFIQNLDPWYFQGASPVLWSEYTLSLPQFFSYGIIRYGYKPFFISDKKEKAGNFLVMENIHSSPIHFSALVTDYRWVLKDMPELKEENYTSTLRNHIARLEFQLAAHNPPLLERNFRTTWPMLTESLLNSASFSGFMNQREYLVEEELKPLFASGARPYDQAKRIYQYVRDHYACSGKNSIWTSQSLRNFIRNKNGNVAEVNLFLTAMLRQSGFKADPVILGTRSHGYVPEEYPMITSFNYVICRLVLDEKIYYLDASRSRLGFGKLPAEIYNGHARVLNEEATAISFSADSVLEQKTTAIFISVDHAGKWELSVQDRPGYFESGYIRQLVSDNGLDQYSGEIQNQYGSGVSIRDLKIDSLDDYDHPVMIRYRMELHTGLEDVLYINPMFGEGYRVNPFLAEERNYPVEMPYAIDETYVLSMEIPEGYEIEEIPKQVIARFSESEESFFEYRIAVSGNTVSLRTRILIARTFFMPEEYEMLKHFFDIIVNKQNERMVFRKKTN